MKFNKWTLGLAALGVVSLASAVKADEKAAPTYLETAVSQTQISGYVGTSAHWNLNGNSSDHNNGNFTSNGGGFNLDAVSVQIQKPLDETDWAAGYNFQLVYGQDSTIVGSPLGYGLNNGSTIKNAYVELRAPLGNGLDIKIGVWDTILGYEVFDRGNNPNYTYSYGYNLEPATYTGVLASYKFCDVVSAQAGVADVANGGGYYGPTSGRAPIDSRKTYLGSIALTAPNSWGVLAGSTLYGAAAYGQTSGGLNQVNYYAGTVINTGVKGLKVGAAYDYVGSDTGSSSGLGVAWEDALALYASFQATDKLSFHGRAEYAWGKNFGSPVGNTGGAGAVYAFTGTVQYDLWKNVLSRAELRWDHAKDGVFTSSSNKDAILLAANLIYKF